MRIGIMLRAIDEKGGIGVYARNIVEELLKLDHQNEYVLFYRSSENLGRFGAFGQVTERVVRGSNKAWWDQIAIPIACKREGIDLLFHPKFTAPFLASCPVVMTVHGADWFMPEQAQFYPAWDVRYVRAVMPLYFRKCAAVISVSELTTQNFNGALRLEPNKVRTVYFAPGRQFRPVSDARARREILAKYNLPQRFIFTLTKRAGDERKNLGQIFHAYERYHTGTADPLPLVVGGKDCHMFRSEYRIPDIGYGADILFPGWLDQQDLPAIYSAATLFLYPSNLEAFPIPLTEAMSCGTPIVTSNVNGPEEIVDGAAALVDPTDAHAIAVAVANVAGDPDLQATLKTKGLQRADSFGWDKCARETLDVFRQVVAQNR